MGFIGCIADLVSGFIIWDFTVQEEELVLTHKNPYLHLE